MSGGDVKRERIEPEDSCTQADFEAFEKEIQASADSLKAELGTVLSPFSATPCAVTDADLAKSHEELMAFLKPSSLYGNGLYQTEDSEWGDRLKKKESNFGTIYDTMAEVRASIAGCGVPLKKRGAEVSVRTDTFKDSVTQLENSVTQLKDSATKLKESFAELTELLKKRSAEIEESFAELTELLKKRSAEIEESFAELTELLKKRSAEIEESFAELTELLKKRNAEIEGAA
jgi:chromosome segregation ATPase